MFVRWPFAHIETDFGDDGLKRQHIEAVNSDKIDTDHTVKRVSQIEVRLVSVGLSLSVFVWGKGFMVRIDLALKGLQIGQYLLVAQFHLFPVDLVKLEVLAKGKKMFLAPVSLQGFGNRLTTAFDPIVLELLERLHPVGQPF